MNAEQMVAARRARMIRRSAWTPHRHPPLMRPKPRGVTVETDVVQPARSGVDTGVAAAAGRPDAAKTDRLTITDKIDITEKIYFPKRSTPLAVAVAGL
jgi:hypothetical protein